MQLSKTSTILILSHFHKRAISGGGPPQEVRDFLLPKVGKIYYIEHPFPYSKDRRSSLTIYENRVLKKQIFTWPLFGPEALFYIFDTLITFYFILIARVRFDLCVALDNLNTVSVLPFKKVGIIKTLVFYTIDYTPTRFENRVLNSIFHFIDRIACYNADAIWVLSERMIEERRKNKVNLEKSAQSVLLPMGASFKDKNPTH